MKTGKFQLLAVLLLASSLGWAQGTKTEASASKSSRFDFGGDFTVMSENAMSRDFNSTLDDKDSRTYSRVRFATKYNGDRVQGKLQIDGTGFWSQPQNAGTTSTSGGSGDMTNSSNGAYGVFVKEAYIHWDITDNTSLMLGRRAWVLGNGLFIGQPTWMADGRGFDGGWVDTNLGFGPLGTSTVFVSTLSEGNTTPPTTVGVLTDTNATSNSRDTTLSGVLLPWKFSDQLNVDTNYFFYHRGTTDNTPTYMSNFGAIQANPLYGTTVYSNVGNQPMAERDIHTGQISAKYATADYDFLGEYYHQRGRLRTLGDDLRKYRTIRADMEYVEAGANFKVMHKARLSAGFLRVGGQNNCKVDEAGNRYWCDAGHWTGFSDHYGSSSDFTGVMQSVYLSNLRTANIKGSLYVNEGVELIARGYWLMKDQSDAPAPTRGGYPNYMNNTNSPPFTRQGYGSADKIVALNGTDIGKELDMAIKFTPNKTMVVAAGYSMFWPGDVFMDKELGRYAFLVGQWFF